MKLFWAATCEDNLILTLDLRHQLEETPSLFGQIIRPDNLAAFQPFQLYTKELISSGIFHGE